MKKTIIVLAFFYSSLAYASVKDCHTLDGNYTCDFQGNQVNFNIQVEEASNLITIDIEGEGGKYIVDGTERLAENQTGTYSATCLSNGTVEVDSYYKGEIEGTVTIEPVNTNKILYTLVKQSQNGLREMQLTCTK